VVSDWEVSPEGQGPARARRRFWFDRANGARFARQEIFDQQGQLATEVQYTDYKKLSAGSPSNGEATWPGVIRVNRPHDGYMARLTFNDEKFEINPELKPNAFTLQNSENLRETDLDKPEKRP
jgi:hypothetical protein